MSPKPVTSVISTTAYQSCSRPRIELRSIDNIPLPAASRDEVLAELAPHVRHVHFNQVRQRVVVLVEQMVVDLRSRHQLAAMQREQLDERILTRRQRHGHASA